jgi:hypothetical protein
MPAASPPAWPARGPAPGQSVTPGTPPAAGRVVSGGPPPSLGAGSAGAPAGSLSGRVVGAAAGSGWLQRMQDGAPGGFSVKQLVQVVPSVSGTLRSSQTGQTSPE